jgi:hypothetical protein
MCSRRGSRSGSLAREVEAWLAKPNLRSRGRSSAREVEAPLAKSKLGSRSRSLAREVEARLTKSKRGSRSRSLARGVEEVHAHPPVTQKVLDPASWALTIVNPAAAAAAAGVFRTTFSRALSGRRSHVAQNLLCALTAQLETVRPTESSHRASPESA